MPLLGIYTRDAPHPTRHLIILFIAVVHVGARNWKQPRCLSNKEWIKKMFYMFAWYVLTCKWRLDIRNRILLLHSTNLKKLHMKDGTSKDA